MTKEELEMSTLTVEMHGCKNCASAIEHILQNYGEIENASVNIETDSISLPKSAVQRVIALLRMSQWNVKLVEQIDWAPCSEDVWFVLGPNLEEHQSHHPLYKCPKRSRLTHSAQLISNPDQTSQSMVSVTDLICIPAPEIECHLPHWVPGWCASFRPGKTLSAIYQHLLSVKPLPDQLNHIKRIDSCRSKGNKYVTLFLGLSEPRYEQAVRLISTLHEAIDSDPLGEDCDLAKPIACWVPFHAPATRLHQIIYSNSNQHLDPNPHQRLIKGWPSTLRTDPQLEKLLLIGRDSSSDYFSAQEIDRHNIWLRRTVKLVHDTTPLPSGPNCSCAGPKGSPCAALIVDPESNELLAECVTHQLRPATSFLDHAVMLAVSKVAQLKRDQPEKYGYAYLCTGFDAYVSMEPCLMCGMALLHNRIRRVFCCNRLLGSGAFTNRIRLHVQKKLNHRFLVFAPVEIPGNFS